MSTDKLFIKELGIRNIKSYRDEVVLELSPSINILTGKNNTGKSTIMRCLQLLQIDNIDTGFLFHLARDQSGGEIDYKFNRWEPIQASWNITQNVFPTLIRCSVKADGNRHFSAINSSDSKKFDLQPGGFKSVEPNNLFVYFLGKRKVSRFDTTHNSATTSAVRDDMRNLGSKIAKIKGASRTVSDEFNRLCEEILGFDISSLSVPNGIEIGIYVDEGESISIDAMGEGVAHIVALIAELCSSSRPKIFLIEELENDLHPEALKALLNLILRHSNRHQFIISTHSNIVLRHLGSNQDTRLFNLSMEFGSDRIPLTKVKRIKSNEDRQLVLRSLGYEPFDFGLWSGYLILEESSAQGIIEKIIIPTFVPELAGKLKIISANGSSKVEASYTELHRMYVYLHTNEIYNKTSWVLVDGDPDGIRAIADLTKAFPSVEPGHFLSLKKDSIELYYPDPFKEEAVAALAVSDKQAKRVAKRDLVEKVKRWAVDNPTQVRGKFEESASEVISILRLVAVGLLPK